MNQSAIRKDLTPPTMDVKMLDRCHFPDNLLMIEAGNLCNVSIRSLESFDQEHQENLASQLVGVGVRNAQAVSISTPTVRLTYQQLLSAASRIAEQLRRTRTFSSGSRVALLMSNSIEYIAGFYGILLADGVAVPIAPGTESHTLATILESTECSTVLITVRPTRLPSLFDDIPIDRVSLSSSGDTQATQCAPSPTRRGSDLAAIFYTAGSTGNPKGVMLSHQALIENARSIQQYLRIQQSDRPLCVLPFYHAFGNSVLQSHLLAGAELILDGNTVFPESLVHAIERWQVTSLSGVPDLMRVLLERTSFRRTHFPSLRYLTVAGGSLQHETSLAMSRLIEPAQFFVMYGQTEATARLAYVPPDQLERLGPACIGCAIPGVELEIVDDQQRPVAIGEVGELRARGPNLMLGYWRDSTATEIRMKDGWLLTGDLASQDEEGWIYHRGRRNSIVKIAGYRVNPSDLEGFAVRRLSISCAVAVPFEAPQLGTRLALYVIAPNGNSLTIPEMQARCRSELPRHMVPHLIKTVIDFPLNNALKIDRIQLSRLAERETSRDRTDVPVGATIPQG